MIEDTKGFIIKNQIKTPDGTILSSNFRHDYKVYMDNNGEEYMVDGGNSYLRRSKNKIPFEELSTSHIHNILNNCNLDDDYIQLFERELYFRENIDSFEEK